MPLIEYFETLGVPLYMLCAGCLGTNAADPALLALVLAGLPGDPRILYYSMQIEVVSTEAILF